MTISIENYVAVATGNDSTTVWPYIFNIPDAASAVVEVYSSVTQVTTVIPAANYTITGLGSESGGTVTYPLSGDPLTSTDTIRIYRDQSIVQPVQITNQTSYFADVVMDVWNKLTMMIQERKGETDRSLKIPVGETTDTDIGETDIRANMLLGFDEGGAVSLLQNNGQGTVFPEAAGVWTYRRAFAGTLRRLVMGQSNAIGRTDLPVGESYPIFSANNLVWNGSSFVTAEFNTGAPWNGAYLSYAPYVAERFVTRTSRISQTVISGQGGQSIDQWTGSTTDRSTHTFSFDNGSGTAYLEDDTLAWTGGTGVITAITDSGATGSIDMKLTSGTGPVDDTALTGSGGKTCDVNGTPVTTNRPQFLDAIAQVAAAGWTQAVDNWDWFHGEADTSMTHAAYVVEYLYLMSELEAWNIVDDETRILVYGHYHDDMDPALFLSGHRNKSATMHLLQAHDPRIVHVSLHGLAAQVDSVGFETRRVHLDFTSLPEVPQRVEASLRGRDQIGAGQMDLTTSFGQQGIIRHIERTVNGGTAMSFYLGGAGTFAESDAISWTGTAPETTGAGTVRRAIDKGDTGRLFVEITSGDPPIEFQEFSSSGKTATVSNNVSSVSSLQLAVTDCMGQIIIADAVAGAVTVTLPDLNTAAIPPYFISAKGYSFSLRVTDASYGITVVPNGEFFSLPSGATSTANYEITRGSGIVDFEYDGQVWRITNSISESGTYTAEIEAETDQGDMTIAYTAQTGRYEYDARTGLVHVQGSFVFVPTYTVAPTGAFMFTLPYSIRNGPISCSCQTFTIPTVTASRYQLDADGSTGDDRVELKMSGSIGATDVTATNITSGNTTRFKYNFWYPADQSTFNRILDGDMSVAGSWTAGTGWTIAAGVATATAGTGSALTQDLAAVIPNGSAVKTKFTIPAFTAGGVQIVMREADGTAISTGTLRTAAGTYIEEFTLTADCARVTMTKDATFAGTVDDVAVRRLS